MGFLYTYGWTIWADAIYHVIISHFPVVNLAEFDGVSAAIEDDNRVAALVLDKRFVAHGACYDF